MFERSRGVAVDPPWGRGHTIGFNPRGGGVTSEFRILGEGGLHTVGFDPAGGHTDPKL